MIQLFEKWKEILQQGRPAVLVSVIASSGSAPGGPGTRMLVDEGGIVTGTIGGGAVEHEAAQLARENLHSADAFEKSYSLRHGTAEDIGMVCGGDVWVFFHPLPPGADSLAFVEKALTCLENREDVWLLFQLSAQKPELCVYSKQAGLVCQRPQGFFAALMPEELAPLLQSSPMRLDMLDGDLCAQPICSSARVVVFGGGHVSQALVPVLAHVGFAVTVFDDREDFAQKALFPAAQEVLLGDFSRIADTLTLRPQDWVVVLTRGHMADYEVLRQVLPQPQPYVGVIGSRAKKAAIEKKLAQAGFSQAVIDSMYTPIGLAIGAKTPQEIAISITAEMIQIRSKQ